MAGYMTKLNGHVYDGAHTAAVALENGVFVEITADGVKPLAAASDAVLRVSPEDGKTILWGMSALTLDVVSHGSGEVFFVENEWDINDNEEYDTSKYLLAAGKLVKMHRILPGEQLIMTVADDVFNTVEIGDKVNPAAGGSVAKASA